MITKQVWKIGDCVELMKELPDKSINLILTDPPWGLGFDYGNGYIDSKENLRILIDRAIPEIMRVAELIAIMPGIANMYLYPEPAWVMCASWNTTGSRCCFGYNQWMPILVYGHDLTGIGKINNVLKSDHINLNGGANVGFMRNKFENMHVCPKPYEIIEWLVRRLSNKYDTVLDPFVGSGTTLVACMKNERNGIGYEINQGFENIIKERLMVKTPKLETWTL